MKLGIVKFLILFLLIPGPLIVADNGTNYYISDSNGIAYDKIENYRKDEFPWVLSITNENNYELRILTGVDGEKARWETFFSNNIPVSQSYWEMKILKEKISFEKGKPVSILKTEENGDLIQILFKYTDNKIALMIIQDSEKKIIRTDEILYNQKGFAYGIKSNFADGHIEFKTEPGVLSNIKNSIKIISGQEYFRNTDQNGNITLELKTENGIILEKITSEYDGKIRKRKIVENVIEKIISESIYDDTGRLISQITSYPDKSEKKEEYKYDENGNLALLLINDGRTYRQIEYFYDETNNLSEEKHLSDGKLEKMVFYPEENKSMEEYYWDNTICAKAWFESGKKIREELFREGEVFYSRVLP